MIGAISAAQGILSELSSLASAATSGSSATDPSTTALGSSSAAGGTSFSDLFGAAIDRLDGAVSTASSQATSFASGNNDVPLSDVMVSMEQANLSLQLASGVRDKVTAAYSNVMNMSV
jgi:flagellar hook-basal body complex protein FliE